jgi:capsule polysaccharide export protein KpsE/RkpR
MTALNKEKMASSTMENQAYQIRVGWPYNKKFYRSRPIRLTPIRIAILILLIIFGVYGLLQILSGSIGPTPFPASAYGIFP